MILPIGTTVAVADSETVRLFHNTGVKPGVHLVEITAALPAAVHSGSRARRHAGSANPDGRRLVEDDFAAATAAFLNKLSLDGTTEHLVVVSDPRTLGEMRKHPPRPERQDHRRVREGLQPASGQGHGLIDRRRLTRL
jgi:protein required for attachment to host cells